MAIKVEVLETDRLFGDSPDTGRKTCLCSRCGELIEEEDVPIRIWPTVNGKVSHYEYRYHSECLET